jgi:multisubunit Na+/H+ antiporter MnhE subunit
MRIGHVVRRLALMALTALFYYALGAKYDFKWFVIGTVIGLVASVPLGIVLTKRKRLKEERDNPEHWITIG